MSLMKSIPIHRNSSKSPKYAKRWKSIEGNLPKYTDHLLLFEMSDHGGQLLNYIAIGFMNNEGLWIDANGEEFDPQPVRYNPEGLNPFDE